MGHFFLEVFLDLDVFKVDVFLPRSSRLRPR